MRKLYFFLDMKNRRGKEIIFPVKVSISKTREIKAYKVLKELCLAWLDF